MGCKFCKKVNTYIFGILYSLDQLGNAILGGNPDQTISGRLGIMKLNNSKFACYFCKVLDFIFREPNHCENSIERDRLGVQAFYLEKEKEAIKNYKEKINHEYDAEPEDERSRYKTEEDR
jgi:hypothetical protein